METMLAPDRSGGAEARFRAMGSDAHLIVVGGPKALLGRGRRRIEDLERRWSRFLPDSEVSRLTYAAGGPAEVSEETVLLVRRSIEAWRLTGASFDPTVLGDVLRAGYDRSFEQIGLTSRTGSSLLGVGCADIHVDGGTVTLPAGTGFDAGGIGKGLAADIVTGELVAAGAAGVCVNLGGDLRVHGESPAGEAWTVAVEHPWTDTPLVRLGLAQGAVATSTTLRRRWLVDGEVRHHLIDPVTGLPSESDLTLATVVAGDAWAAEVLAKAVLLRGSAHPFDLIDGSGAEGLVVDHDGTITVSFGLPEFLGGASIARRIIRRAVIAPEGDDR